MHLQINTLFDLDLAVKAAQNVTQYPFHHVTYSGTKFEVARPNGLGGDTFTRNVTDVHTHRRKDRLWYEINIPFLFKEKSGYENYKYNLNSVDQAVNLDLI